MLSRYTTIVLVAAAVAMPHPLFAESDKKTSPTKQSTVRPVQQPRVQVRTQQRAKPVSNRQAQQDRMNKIKAYLAKQYGRRTPSRKKPG